ncbi:MAG: hypothetical protein RL264_1708 [Bacteroidota bacterium]|jgi:cytochrome c peroxidase
MKSFPLLFALVICGGVFMLFQCQSSGAVDWNSTVIVPFPEDNPTTAEKVELGKQLFFDKRLSVDGSVACANCHRPEFAFTDRLPVSKGVKGQLSTRNSPSILNSGFLKTVMFDAHLKTLELQVIVPIQEPVEMGHNMKVLIPELRKIPAYQSAAKRIFNRDFDAYVLTRSIAAYERSLVSMNSRFDQYQRGKMNAISKLEKKGWQLFSEKLYCTQCHPAPYFTTFVAENNGLYQEYGEDKGRFRIAMDSNDIGKFKVPSLRNITLTYPYMHDGKTATLNDVLDHYSKGGVGHFNQSKFIQPFHLSTQERKALLAFFGSLTDTSYLKSKN